MASASDFAPGDKVFLDSIGAGLVPAVVVRSRPEVGDVRVRYTARRGPFRVGTEEEWKASQIVKREWVHARSGTLVVREPRRSNPSSNTNMLVGGASGAVLGAVVGGPVGAAAGAVGGALVGAAASGRGRMTNPKTFSNPWGAR